MKNKKFFFSQNLLISVAGHVLAASAMIVVGAVIIPPVARIVAPASVQIIEMDLNNVKVSGTETLVYNTTAPKPTETTATPATTKPKPDEKTPDWQADNPKPKPANTAQPQPTDATTKPNDNTPGATTTVRVNRETAPLTRTMTVSVIDALRMAMTRCWTFDRTRNGINDIRAVAHLTMNQNGMVNDVWFEEATRADTDPAFSYILETIRMAINTCQPFRMLPPSEFDTWKSIQLTFYPSNASVQ
ncbi:MAG: hypothetical protein FWC51_04880 [Proteobacteria bacterium]|nr:hypothetical protein [Pseudomonadota bacterium]